MNKLLKTKIRNKKMCKKTFCFIKKKEERPNELNIRGSCFHSSLGNLLKIYLKRDVEGSNCICKQEVACRLNGMTNLFMTILNALERTWSYKGFIVFIYLDVITLFRRTKS